MGEGQRTVLVRITGRVQGVWFRGWTKKKADALGLTGWVRNRPDLCVEAQFTGPSDLIDKMVVQCGRGPVLAKVDEVSFEELDNDGLDRSLGLEIRATG